MLHEFWVKHTSCTQQLFSLLSVSCFLCGFSVIILWELLILDTGHLHDGRIRVLFHRGCRSWFILCIYKLKEITGLSRESLVGFDVVKKKGTWMRIQKSRQGRSIRWSHRLLNVHSIEQLINLQISRS